MERQKYLGIDYGDKRVGLALAESGSIALPYKILSNQGEQGLLNDIKEVINQEDIDVVVVGIPHSLSGNDNDRARITKQFVDFLTNNLSVQVATVDEQMTSKLFEKMGVKNDIDKHSAGAILDTYLNQQQSG